MLIEDSGLNGIQCELRVLDEATAKNGFVRWQWEYYRATYDYEHEQDYILRINARVTEEKMESPSAVLEIQDVYAGKKQFPHGVDYNAAIPADVLSEFKDRLQKLHAALS